MSSQSITTQNSRNNEHSMIHGLLATAISLLVLLIGAGFLLVYVFGAVRYKQMAPVMYPGIEAEEAALAPHAFLNLNELTPEQALANDRPTVLFFYPTDLCAMRYCLSPEFVRSAVDAKIWETADFVVVTARSVSETHDPRMLPLDNWAESYPAHQYDWVPTELNGPRIVVLDLEHQLVFDSGLNGTHTEMAAGIDTHLAAESSVRNHPLKNAWDHLKKRNLELPLGQRV